MKIFVKERLSQHRYETPEGYLVCVDAILARTGQQEYLRRELDMTTDSDERVMIDRNEDEVFSSETLASFENKPITFDHPSVEVNSANCKDYAIGYVRDIKKGEINKEPVMLGTLVITDKDAIEKIKSGEYTDLSCGYDCDIVDNAQTNIRGNHVALCKEGRAGIARIVDTAIEDDSLSPMTYKKLKELGYSSDDWKNWSQEEANERIHSHEKKSENNKPKEEQSKDNDKYHNVIEKAVERGKIQERMYNGSYGLIAKKSEFEQIKKELEKRGYDNVRWESNPYNRYTIFFDESAKHQLKTLQSQYDNNQSDEIKEKIQSSKKFANIVNHFKDVANNAGFVSDISKNSKDEYICTFVDPNDNHYYIRGTFTENYANKPEETAFTSIMRVFKTGQDYPKGKFTAKGLASLLHSKTYDSINDRAANADDEMEFIRNAPKIYKRNNNNVVFVVKTISDTDATGYASVDGGKTWETAKTRIVKRSDTTDTRHQNERRFSASNRSAEIPFSHIVYCYHKHCSVIPNETIDHKNGDHMNDNINNLEAVSNVENIRRDKIRRMKKDSIDIIKIAKIAKIVSKL